jgi:hypothetical protein
MNDSRRQGSPWRKVVVGELCCPAWIASGLGCNWVLEEEESIAVLRVGSDGDGIE